jgi:valyl-tRNA synthetase
VPVPVVAHELADPEKGTGIAMICTFGDVTDVTWWRELGLPRASSCASTAPSRTDASAIRVGSRRMPVRRTR